MKLKIGTPKLVSRTGAWILCLIILICGTGLSGLLATADSQSVIVKEYSLTPSVLMPGEKGLFTAILKGSSGNTQVSSISNGKDSTSTTSAITPYVESVVLSSKDVEILGTGSRFEGSIGPDQEVPITFLIQAHNGQSGIFFADILIRVRNGQTLKYPVPINVNTQISVMKNPSITVNNTFSGMVKPGSRIDGTVVVGNIGSSQADNIQMEINGSPDSVIPVGISNFQVESLPPGKEREQNLSLLVNKNARSGLVMIPISVSYARLDGTQSNQESAIGLDIRGESEISITSVETLPSRISPNSPFDLVIRVQNTGTGDVKSLSATIDLPFGGSTEAFVGKIKSGNDAPATFVLEGGQAGNYPYHIIISWTDDWGIHSIRKDLTLSITDTGDSASLPLVIMGILILAVGSLYFWNRRKRED